MRAFMNKLIIWFASKWLFSLILDLFKIKENISKFVLTAAKNERTRLSVHWKISQLHGALSLYSQPVNQTKDVAFS